MPRLFGFGVGALLTKDEAIAALGLTACAQLQFVITQQLFGGKEKALGAAGPELELSLAELAGGLARVYGAIIYGSMSPRCALILRVVRRMIVSSTGWSAVPCTAFWMTRLIFLSAILARSGL